MKREKIVKKKLKNIIVIIIFLTLFFTILYWKVFKEDYLTKDYIRLNLVDIYYQEDFSIITLSNSCYYFEFYTTKEQGNSIEIAYRNLEIKRPLAHDIIIEIMRRFEIEPKLLRIDKIINDTYYATIVLKDIFKHEEIDIRPSDGVAIAVRADVPIYVHKSLVKSKCELKSF
ncbi:MAG: bifunctional nuclease family protein [Candidatus Aenigmatarchaeota archaeon]|nr:bifunctional nuclease family protein [Candidatus Aenigmarchaeota archaeon]